MRKESLSVCNGPFFADLDENMITCWSVLPDTLFVHVVLSPEHRMKDTMVKSFADLDENMIVFSVLK